MITFPLPNGPLPPAGDVIRGWQITSPFGPRAGGTHGGVDLAYSGCAGQPIMAPVAGSVCQGWDSSGGGNWTGLRAADGAYWGMGHASGFEPGVNGAWVPAGQRLAYVGSTGHSSGPHLHLAYRPPGAGSYVDPLGELMAAAFDAGVKMTQELLAGLGYDVGTADGLMGPKTQTAVRAFQTDHGLTVDGLIGPQTNGEIARLYAPLVTDPRERIRAATQVASAALADILAALG